MSSGRFIAFEGGEASGKSTQAARLAASLGAVLTREPGGTQLGQYLRRLVLGPEGDDRIDIRAEALLLAADRAQHVATVIRPALAAGRHVVTDRYAGSSLAYQGYGRGLDVEHVRRLSDWASQGLWPDLVVLLDVPPAVARARMSGAGDDLDRLELAGADFHQRVADGFRALAASSPDTWRIVDGTGDVDEVAAQVTAVVRAHFVQAKVE
ncbi:MAG TPA: dTMP kinase [Acidimicrobiales bacterium]|nr:dTMP kinase [Acidimicrobiales bacterium]